MFCAALQSAQTLDVNIILKTGCWNSLRGGGAVQSNAELWLAGNEHLMVTRHTQQKTPYHDSRRKSGGLKKKNKLAFVKLEPWPWVTVGSSCPGFTTSIFWWRRCTCWSPGRGRCSVSFSTWNSFKRLNERANVLTLARTLAELT